MSDGRRIRPVDDGAHKKCETMQPWLKLATATAPAGRTLRLIRRGAEFSIRLEGGTELMNSRVTGSEEALAALALGHLTDNPAPRLLIGGWGWASPCGRRWRGWGLRRG